jgi:four helix bundle protein
MAVPESFRSRAFRFALEIIKFYRSLSATTDTPRHLLNQFLGAGTSIGANIEEAKCAYSRRDMAAEYSIALRESRECRYWLRLIVADQPHVADHGGLLIEQCSQFVAMLTTTVRKLRITRTAARTV